MMMSGTSGCRRQKGVASLVQMRLMVSENVADSLLGSRPDELARLHASLVAY